MMRSSASNCAPLNQFDWPVVATVAPRSTAPNSIHISACEKTNRNCACPMAGAISTRTGATKRAICTQLPMAMPMLRSTRLARAHGNGRSGLGRAADQGEHDHPHEHL